MGNNNELTKSVNSLREIMKKELAETWKEGYAAGAVSTCGILYKTFQIAGLEETNMLFTILKDLANKNGCSDLPAYVKQMKS